MWVGGAFLGYVRLPGVWGSFWLPNLRKLAYLEKRSILAYRFGASAGPVNLDQSWHIIKVRHGRHMEWTDLLKAKKQKRTESYYPFQGLPSVISRPPTGCHLFLINIHLLVGLIMIFLWKCIVYFDLIHVPLPSSVPPFSGLPFSDRLPSISMLPLHSPHLYVLYMGETWYVSFWPGMICLTRTSASSNYHFVILYDWLNALLDTYTPFSFKNI